MGIAYRRSKKVGIAHPTQSEVSDIIRARSEEDGRLRVNWFERRALFDWVEIVRAADEEVERFAVQVGNDTDSIRRRKYKKMRCVIALECKLSENTLRILRSRFGRVEYQA